MTDIPIITELRAQNMDLRKQIQRYEVTIDQYRDTMKQLMKDNQEYKRKMEMGPDKSVVAC